MVAALLNAQHLKSLTGQRRSAPRWLGARLTTTDMHCPGEGTRLTVLIFSDAVLEARAAGRVFGTDRLVDHQEIEARQQSPPETLRRLVLAVLRTRKARCSTTPSRS